jgi:hypothetical protein
MLTLPVVCGREGLSRVENNIKDVALPRNRLDLLFTHYRNLDLFSVVVMILCVDDICDWELGIVLFPFCCRIRGPRPASEDRERKNGDFYA